MSNSYIPSVYIPLDPAPAPKLDLGQLKVGDEVPGLMRRGDFQHWNRFAAVNHEFAGHHMDDDVARHEGFDAAIGMGPFINALLHVMLRQWIGEENGRVVKVTMQVRRPWIRGGPIFEGGKVTAFREEKGEVLISLDVWGKDDKDQTIVMGEAEVAVPVGAVAGRP